MPKRSGQKCLAPIMEEASTAFSSFRMSRCWWPHQRKTTRSKCGSLKRGKRYPDYSKRGLDMPKRRTRSGSMGVSTTQRCKELEICLHAAKMDIWGTYHCWMNSKAWIFPRKNNWKALTTVCRVGLLNLLISTSLENAIGQTCWLATLRTWTHRVKHISGAIKITAYPNLLPKLP